MTEPRTAAEVGGPGAPRCSDVSRTAREPMAGSAPRADVWVAVEHPLGWGDAALARSGHGVRILMTRGPRPPGADAGGVTRPGGQGVRVWVGYATGTPVLRVGLVDRPEDVAGWDLADIAAGSLRAWGEPDPEPLLLVCANGRRDRCCGHEGGRLAETLWRGPHRERVLTCTHLGGHRFAPTALLLPVGALHGRLDESSATGLIEEAADGRMRASTLRGFSTLDAPAQVAEAHVRARTDYRGLIPLRVDLASDRDPDGIIADVHRRVDPLSGDRTDPLTGDRTDPNTGDRTDLTTGDRTDPNTGDRTDPNTGDRTDPTTGHRTDPTTDDRTDPTTGHRTDTPGPADATATVRIRLTRTSVPALMACGRHPELSTHWRPA